MQLGPKAFIKVTATFTLASALLSACQPADKKIETVKKRLESGQLVEFTKPGYRRPSCTERQPDWTDIRLGDEAERERIISGQQRASLNPGKHSCFRVGSAISLSANFRLNGKVVINKISVVRLENLPQKAMSGAFFAKSDDFGKYKDEFKRKLGERDEGYVTVVDFTYVKGSAPDEAAVLEKVRLEAEGDGLTQTEKDGQTISTCRNPWTELLAPAEFHEPLLNGKLRSFYRVGDLNCLPQGALVEIKAQRGESAKGMVRIGKVKKFRLKHLGPAYFNLGEYPYADLERAIKSEKAQEWITVMEVQPAAAPTEVTK